MSIHDELHQKAKEREARRVPAILEEPKKIVGKSVENEGADIKTTTLEILTSLFPCLDRYHQIRTP